ncbi:MAG: LL-diaminopimelate aminotransferase [bacterium]|nr:MAG: LL-diaminopimelate aminotransferase [bacterium]
MSLTARRVLDLPPYMFAEIDRVKRRMLDEGHKLLDFGVGDPDLPTPAFIVEAMIEAARLPRHHRYPGYAGMKSFRQAAAAWCERRHGIQADPDREVLALIGSKEGISHLPLALVDPGDLVLVTDPGYPVYVNSIRFAGGEVALVPLAEENGWLPDLDAIDPALADRAKMMIVNYPNNPIGATADRDFFERLIAWARKHDVFLMHDAAYIEVGYDGWRSPSLLALPGGKDIGIEFHSLSKTFNMTGWRVGYAIGNEVAIKALATVKTQIDSGVFEPVQVAATLAYQQGEAALADILAVYQRRRDRMVPALRAMGLDAMSPRGAFYIWTRVPAGENSAGFARRLLETAGVVVMPGTGFGARGEGWFRFSLTVPDAQIDELLALLPKALG